MEVDVHPRKLVSLRRMKAVNKKILKVMLSSKENVLVIQSGTFASSYICRHAPRIEESGIDLRRSSFVMSLDKRRSSSSKSRSFAISQGLQWT